MQHILLRLLIIAAQSLHQLLDGRVRGNEHLDVRGVIPAVQQCGVLPRGCLGGEDVDLAVRLRERVVVSWGQADATGVVPEMDPGERRVCARGRRWVGLSRVGVAVAVDVWGCHVWRLRYRGYWGYHGYLHGWEAIGLWRGLGREESRVLRDAKSLVWSEIWWWWALVEAVQGVVSSASHRIWLLLSIYWLLRLGIWWWRAWISSVDGVPAVVGVRNSFKVSNEADQISG